MLMKIMMLLEIVAFLFLALGIIPFKRIQEDGNLPLLNKVLFTFVAGIIFSILALTSVSYGYTNCYINETSMIDANNTVNVSTCDITQIEDIGLSYLNWGLSILSVIIMVILILITAFSKHDSAYNEKI